jgi:cation transport ATPase
MARLALFAAGIPHSVPAFSLDRKCGSGLTAIALAARSIMADEIDVVLWDKTGTLTSGRLTVSVLLDRAGRPVADPSWLPLAAAVEEGSRHPFAAAVCRESTERGHPVGAASAQDVTESGGAGVRGTVDGVPVVVGRADRWELTPPPALQDALERLAGEGGSTAVVAVDGAVVGAIVTSDSAKPSARSALFRLRDRGIRSIVLSGDNAGAAERVSRDVGADSFHADLRPADKVDHIRALQELGHRVAMVGDGINDGPALAAADLGIAVGRGTDVAIEAADIVLVRDDLDGVAEVIELATATRRTIRGNLVWAFGYNVAAIPIAVAGFANPLVASVAMAGSSLFVVFNSMRLSSR